ncbi:MAG: HNH endonuclease [Mycobacterium sp.]|uniref:HNH endonuclease n=2 Tax=Mycobacterium sp. TaxID=1785 RepID=UPI003F9D3158
MFESLMVDPDADESALVERIAELERIKSAAAAGQARAAAALDATRRTAEAAAGVPAAGRGRGVASEIALARRDSPVRGNRHLGFAKALVYEMPHTLAALEAGVLTEWRATLIVRESACLDVEDRRALDAELCADPAALDGMGDARVAAAAKTIAYRLDPHAVVDRAAKAETERTVSIRPAPDTMTYLTALLPVAQGVSVYAALRREADTRTDGRSRGQVMADTLVERVTGRSAAAATPIAVNLVLSDQTLLGGSSAPADVCGYGPIPAAVARGLVCGAVTDERSRATLRRLYAHPASGALVAMESRARLFPRGLAAFIGLRDQRCRTPYCDAPIRHRDHARAWASGGVTSAGNGLGLCEQCNYVKEVAGWAVESGIDEKCRHTAEFTTPTGRRYRSGAPPLPTAPARMEISQMEIAVGIAFSGLHAA